MNDQTEWPKWNAEMKAYLAKAQARDETKHQFGSWYFGGDEHASVGGRLYHTSLATMLGETVELTVRASNRDCYAVGALLAAQFVAKQAPGLYSMSEVLGL